MLVDFGTVLKNLDGVELKDGDKTLTLGLICANALLIAGTKKKKVRLRHRNMTWL